MTAPIRNFKKSAQKPRVYASFGGEREVTATPIATPDVVTQKNALPGPVEMRGRMTSAGYQPENAAYRDDLTDVLKGKRVGRDPLGLSLALLTASGHPRRTTVSVKRALARIEDCEPDQLRTEGFKGWKGIRRRCIDCAGNTAEARRCLIIDCPAWPYRIGRSPYHTLRGRDGFVSHRSEGGI